MLLAAWLAAAALPAASLRGLLSVQVEAARKVAPALGVHVVDLASGETVYEYNADRPRIIASNTKLFTTATALELLSPGYYFETRLLARGPVVDGRLEGSLAVIGSGDPNISGRHYYGDSLAVFREWGRALREAGIRQVDGEVLLHHGLFLDAEVHPDWPRDQLNKWYEAPVEALSFNDNCVLVRVFPGTAPGRPARVEIVPPLPIFSVENSAVTTSSARRQRVVIDRRRGTNQLIVRGAVYRRSDPVDSWVTVEDPVQYFGSALLVALREAGVEVTGEAMPVTELPPAGWRQVTESRTDLLTTVEVINKRSQNFYAESLLKVLGALFCEDGSWSGGVRVVREFLEERLGFDAASYDLADGSGMSRNNRFTPRQLTGLLRYMYGRPLGRQFMLSLPYSGEEDLRWEKRLEEPPYRGNVFAKTGGLNGVSTLSGYAKARSGKVYAFSILCNQASSNWAASRAQDRIVRALIDGG